MKKQNKLPSCHIGICIPSGDIWQADFGMSITYAILNLMQSPIKGKDPRNTGINIYNSKGSILPKSREKLVDMCVEDGMDYVFFVDTDMVIHPSTIRFMVELDKDIVGLNCPTKMIPSTPTARNKNGEWAGEPVYSSTEKEPLSRVWRVGTGVMMIKASIFKDIPKPWFPIQYDESRGGYIGEDWGFCEKAEAAGFEIWCDHELSLAVQHVGQLRYEHRHIARRVDESEIVTPDRSIVTDASGVDVASVLKETKGNA